MKLRRRWLPGAAKLSDGPVEAGGPAWRRAAILGSLAAFAVLADVLQVVRPEWNGRTGPALLALATAVVAVPVLRHSRRVEAVATATWRGFGVIAALLALGHVLRAVTDVGVNPSAPGLSDLPLAATGPVAAVICVRLVRSTGGRIRVQSVLDAAVALAALGLLLEMLGPLTVGLAAGRATVLLTVGYPAISALLCAAGLVTFAGVSAPRRAAAGWLVLTFASLGATMVSGALAVGRPSPLLPRTAWRATSPRCTRWAASCPWTTSAAASRRWPTLPVSRSTS